MQDKAGTPQDCWTLVFSEPYLSGTSGIIRIRTEHTRHSSSALVRRPGKRFIRRQTRIDNRVGLADAVQVQSEESLWAPQSQYDKRQDGYQRFADVFASGRFFGGCLLRQNPLCDAMMDDLMVCVAYPRQRIPNRDFHGVCWDHWQIQASRGLDVGLGLDPDICLPTAHCSAVFQ